MMFVPMMAWLLAASANGAGDVKCKCGEPCGYTLQGVLPASDTYVLDSSVEDGGRWSVQSPLEWVPGKESVRKSLSESLSKRGVKPFELLPEMSKVGSERIPILWVHVSVVPDSSSESGRNLVSVVLSVNRPVETLPDRMRTWAEVWRINSLASVPAEKPDVVRAMIDALAARFAEEKISSAEEGNKDIKPGRSGLPSRFPCPFPSSSPG